MQKKGYQNNLTSLRYYTLTNNEEISPGIHVISFLRDFDFNPGQVLKIAVDKNHFEDELEIELNDNYARCCSGESSGNTFRGRVTEYLINTENLPDVKYYICGQASMVVEVRDLLIKKGIKFENIMAEIYF
jgi:NAD(P)H-flavin reductase